GGGEPGRGIERGDVAARLPADTGEETPGVDRGATHREGEHVSVRPRVPSVQRAVGPEVGQVAARHAPDPLEAAADVPAARAVGHRGEYGAFHARPARVWAAGRRIDADESPRIWP